jgi:hypothetical protein
MLANALRIGNYVITLCGYEKITDILCDSINTYNQKYLEYELVNPIPLNEEILLKCGFEKSNDLDKFYHLDLLNEWTRIYFNPKHNICQLSINQYDSCIRIKYLHELQNIYFALTNEELQIEL